MRPAVPVYWRWTPTVVVPYDEHAVMPRPVETALRPADAQDRARHNK